MKIGTENKKSVYALAVLGVVAAISLYINVFSDSYSRRLRRNRPPSRNGNAPPRKRQVARATPVPGPVSSSQATTSPRQLSSSGRSRGDEFHPSLRSKRKEDQIDPLTVDPTLHLELLAKVQNVKLDGGQRNLFQFGKPEQVAELKGPEPESVPVKRAPWARRKRLLRRPRPVRRRRRRRRRSP